MMNSDTLYEIVATSDEGAEEEGGVDDGQAGHVGIHDVVGTELAPVANQFNETFFTYC